jgi:hypothetical protein
MNDSTATDQNRILDFLARVDRRLRVNEALGGLSLGLWGLPVLLLLARFTGFWEQPSARAALLLIYGAALAGFVAWTASRRKGLLTPAGVTDARSDAKDALKSSLDFIGLPERTRWMEFQIRRTAGLAQRLAPGAIAPTVLPRQLYYAAGLALVLAALFSWNPVWLQEVDATTWFASSDAVTADALSEDEAEALPELEQKLQELDQALEALRQRELEMPETLRDLQAAKEALAASRLEMEKLDSDLENLGAELETTPGLAELAEAMKSKDARKAAELLRALAEKLKNAGTSEELKALLESLKDANVQQADLAELLERLEKTQGSLSPESLAEMAQALQDAASQLESMGEQMAADQALEAMGEEMQSLQAAMGQQQQGAGKQQPGQQQAGGQATQSAGMMSSQLQMAQFQGDPSSAVPVDAGPAGDATGPGGGEEPVLGEPTTLDVQLEMELLKTKERDEPIPEEIFERLSRQEKSTLNYEALSQRGAYAEDAALGHESIPWLYRSLVKRYFLSIVSRSEAKSESGSEK